NDADLCPRQKILPGIAKQARLAIIRSPPVGRAHRPRRIEPAQGTPENPGACEIDPATVSKPNVASNGVSGEDETPDGGAP
ncbi:MAG: hypothetical protein NTU91_09840, partial [Chloroflexi bacterium]|nr:hypothetical protein [Chloroflexota bacterium]